MTTAYNALKKIIRLVEQWADDQKKDHNNVLLKILETALKATDKIKKK
jgi:hypothetical protein